MNNLLESIWPTPDHPSAVEHEETKQRGEELDRRIRALEGLAEIEPAAHLDAARRIADEEDRRKTGVETRATTFIAAVATLIPLMTWALGNTETSACKPGWGCTIWTAVFILAVVYFVTAAYWSLQSLAVANYHVIAVEEIIHIREQGKNLYKETIRETLLLARKNRDTINQKLTYIKVAQRRFFNGLAVLGLLLMFDPVSRFGVWTFVKTEIEHLFEKAPRSLSKPSGVSLPADGHGTKLPANKSSNPPTGS